MNRLHCSLGNHDLPADAFWRNNASPTGYMSSCKSCQTKRRRERDGVQHPRPVRERRIIGGVPYISCKGCGPRPESAFLRRQNRDGSSRPDSYCKRCLSARRTQAHQRRLVRELSAPPGTPTPLIDALRRSEARCNQRKKDKRRQERADRLAVCRYRIRTLRDLGATWRILADAAGLHWSTVRRWADDNARSSPRLSTLRRALAAWDTLVPEPALIGAGEIDRTALRRIAVMTHRRGEREAA